MGKARSAASDVSGVLDVCELVQAPRATQRFGNGFAASALSQRGAQGGTKRGAEGWCRDASGRDDAARQGTGSPSVGDANAQVEPGPGYYQAGMNTKTVGFGIRHPFIASEIGQFSKGSTNISTNAVRFSTNDLGLTENGDHEGSQVNAFRHVLWQATIATRFGDDIATQVGNAHEDDPWATSGKGANVYEFDTMSLADQSADLRNNVIGRGLGDTEDPKKMNELALRTLDAFHDQGLWVVEKTPEGRFRIVQQKLSDEQYAQAKARLQQLDEDGYDADQRAALLK